MSAKIFAQFLLYLSWSTLIHVLFTLFESRKNTREPVSILSYYGNFLKLQEARSVVIARNLEISEVERGLGNSIKAVENEIKKTLSAIDNVASDEANLETKIEKKKQEFERNQKRLATLQSVRSVQAVSFTASPFSVTDIELLFVLQFSCFLVYVM